jgi:curved DNA-binding protein CbpA
MASRSARDCYEILGVGRDVGPDALRTAYRKACLRTHPDKPGGCAARFRAVVAAYETLSDPALRAAADAGGWSAGDALHRQQARAASSAAEAAKQAELLRRAEELARSAEARRVCAMHMRLQPWASAGSHMPRTSLLSRHVLADLAAEQAPSPTLDPKPDPKPKPKPSPNASPNLTLTRTLTSCRHSGAAAAEQAHP